MKKLNHYRVFALFMTLMLCLAGCGKKDFNESAMEPVATGSEVVQEESVSLEEYNKVPAEYAYSVTISINPKITLYVIENEDGEVVVDAWMFENADAKEIYGDTNFYGCLLEEATENVVRLAYEADYIKKDTVIEVTTNSVTIDAAELTVATDAVKSAAEKSLKDLGAAATVEVKEAEEVVDTETPEATAEPKTAEPTESPKATVAPTNTPKATEAPKTTVAPTATPKATVKPTATPVVTPEPTPVATPVPTPDPTPVPTLEPTPVPECPGSPSGRHELTNFTHDTSYEYDVKEVYDSDGDGVNDMEFVDVYEVWSNSMAHCSYCSYAHETQMNNGRHYSYEECRPLQ